MGILFLGGYENMEMLQKISLIVTIVGAINWGLIGILDVDLVALLFGTGTFLTRVIYTLVGVCGLINIGIFMAHLEYGKD